MPSWSTALIMAVYRMGTMGSLHYLQGCVQNQTFKGTTCKRKKKCHMPQEEGRGLKGPKWALYSVVLVVPHHLKTVISVTPSTHGVLEDSSKHVGSAFCHCSKLPEMVILLRKRFSWLTVSEVPVCGWMDLWLWASAAHCDGHAWWSKIAYTISLRHGEKGKRSRVYTSSPRAYL